jgi:hypothetical protein
MTWLRETPYSLCYYLFVETRSVPQGNDLGYSKNAKDWAIRRRVPKAAKSTSMRCEIGHGTVSETAKALVFNDDLINLRMLKVQSVLLGNMEWKPRGGLYITMIQIMVLTLLAAKSKSLKDLLVHQQLLCF